MGERQTVELFSSIDPPTAVFAAIMKLDLQFLAGLRQLGLRVPRHVSLVGFVESPREPPLTTVATLPVASSVELTWLMLPKARRLESNFFGQEAPFLGNNMSPTPKAEPEWETNCGA